MRSYLIVPARNVNAGRAGDGISFLVSANYPYYVLTASCIRMRGYASRYVRVALWPLTLQFNSRIVFNGAATLDIFEDPRDSKLQLMSLHISSLPSTPGRRLTSRSS